MKRNAILSNLKIIVIVGIFFFLSSCSLPRTQTVIIYKTPQKAQGKLIWQIEDLQENLIDEGTVQDGEWQRHGVIMVDGLFLKTKGKKVELALLPFGTTRCPQGNFSFQIFYNGKIYPGTSSESRFIVGLPIIKTKKDLEDFRKGQANYEFGKIFVSHHFGLGCYVSQIIITDSIKTIFGDKYIFTLLKGTNYFWKP